MRTVISALAICITALLGYLVYTNWWPSAHGAVFVMSEPPGAQVWVDLKPTDAITNGKVNRLSRGKHSVTVRLDTLLSDPFAQIVEIGDGRTDTVHFLLHSPRWGAPTTATSSSRPKMQYDEPLTPESLLATIPTAADVRAASGSAVSIADSYSIRPTTLERETHRPASGDVEGLPMMPPSADESPQSRSEDKGGAIQISSSEAGARIYLNDHELAEHTPATINVPFGTYTLRVELEGYTVSPDQQSVRIGRASSSPVVHFTLDKTEKAIRAFAVQTVPVEGRIFVDGILVGEGAANCEREYGTYTVTFGDIEGWHTPKPMRVSLTPSNSHPAIEAHYSRLFHAFAEAHSENDAATEGMGPWTAGVIFEDHQPQPSSQLGPRIRAIPNSQKFGWELAMGDPNRNPTGGDYVTFTFTLPADVPPDSPLNLRLYLYRSERKYPWTLSGGHAEIVVSVNDRKFLDGFTPRYESYAADLDRYEEWSLHHVLKLGENRILIYTGDGNTIFNYLWKVEIL